MAISMTAGVGFPNQAAQAAQMQQAIADQQRLRALAGAQNGSLNGDEFRALAQTIGVSPQDRGPIDRGNQGLGDQGQRAYDDMRSRRNERNITLPDGTRIHMQPENQRNLTLPDGTRIQMNGNAGGGLPGLGGGGMANQAAQFQMMAIDQQQAQTIYEQIAGRSRNFSTLYDKYSNGDYHPTTSLPAGDAHRINDLYAAVRSGNLSPEGALQGMR